MKTTNESTNKSNGSRLAPTTSLRPTLTGGTTLKKTWSTPNAQLDFVRLTTRLIVTSALRDPPAPVESLRDRLNEQFPSSYQIFSLDPNPSPNKSADRIVHLSFANEKSSPSLADLLNLCQKVFLFLLESPTNVAAIFAQERKSQLAVACCSLIAFGKMFPSVDKIVQFYEYRRCVSSALTNSQKKFVQYFADLAFGVIGQPHLREVTLKSLSFAPIPKFNRQKNGCRPFVEIFTDEGKIRSTYAEPSKIRSFTTSDGLASIPLNFPVRGDLIFRLSHAPSGISLQDAKNRICQFRFNSNFVTKTHPKLVYSKNEFEYLDSTDRTSPAEFKVTLESVLAETSSIDDPKDLLGQLETTLKSMFVLFRDQDDSQKCIGEFLRQSNTSNREETRGKEQSGNHLTLSGSLTSSWSSQRFSTSSTSNPQSPSSFVNPLHNPMRMLSRSNSKPAEAPTKINEEKVHSSPPESNCERPVSPNPKSHNLLVDTTPNGEAELPSPLVDLLDILGSGSDERMFSSISKPESLPDIQRVDSTVLKEKIREWTDGKKRNIRALLSSLSTVTWPECGWKGCEMHELVTVDQVTRAYRKAVLHIHPDKLRNDPNEALAILIFVELNEAWSQFNHENHR